MSARCQYNLNDSASCPPGISVSSRLPSDETGATIFRVPVCPNGTRCLENTAFNTNLGSTTPGRLNVAHTPLPGSVVNWTVLRRCDPSSNTTNDCGTRDAPNLNPPIYASLGSPGHSVTRLHSSKGSTSHQPIEPSTPFPTGRSIEFIGTPDLLPLSNSILVPNTTEDWTCANGGACTAVMSHAGSPISTLVALWDVLDVQSPDRNGAHWLALSMAYGITNPNLPPPARYSSTQVATNVAARSL